MAKDESKRKKDARGDEGRPRRRPRDDDDDDDEDEAEDEDRPRRRRPRGDEEEDQDDRPRRRRSGRDDDDEPRRKRRPRDEEADEDEVEDEDEDEEEDQPRKGSTRKKWEKVHLGLGFSIAAAAMLLGAIGALVLSVVLVIVAALLSWAELGTFSGVLVLVAGVLYVGMEIPAVVGFAFCLNTPNKYGALPLAIISLVIGSINLIVRIIFLVLPFLDQGSSVGLASFSVAGWILLIFGDVEWIIFPFYMKAAMRTLRDNYLAESTNIPIALACGEIGFKIALAFVVSVKMVRGEGGVPMIATVLGAVVLLVILFFALSYLKTIIAVRKRVGARLPTRSEDTP